MHVLFPTYITVFLHVATIVMNVYIHLYVATLFNCSNRYYRPFMASAQCNVTCCILFLLMLLLTTES